MKKDIYFTIKNLDGEVLHTNKKFQCKCFANCKNGKLRCTQTGKVHSFLEGVLSEGLFLELCMSDSTALGRNLKSVNTILSIILPTITGELNLQVSSSKKVTDRVIHNLKSYSASASQAIYNLIPQEDFGKGGNEQIDFIQKKILEDPQKSSKTFLRILKNIEAISREFKVVEMLGEQSTKLKTHPHSIHQVILLVLNSFWLDFIEKGIWIDLHETNEKVLMDYPSTHAALGLILENAAKYSLPNSKLSILFSKSNKTIFVIFDMISLKIDQSEVNDIFKEGYSGILPTKIGNAGKGIGLSLAQKLLKLNDVEIEVYPNINPELNQKKLELLEYENNQFILKFKCK